MSLNQAVRDLRAAVEPHWPTPSQSDSLIWLFTEVGELAQELSRLPGFLDIKATRNNPRVGSLARVSDEAADVLLMLVSVCEDFDIDLEQVFYHRLKELLERYSSKEA